MNAFISKNLTALAVPLLPISPSAREAMITMAPCHQPELREKLAKVACAAPFATDVADVLISARYFAAPARMPKASGLISRSASREMPRTAKGSKDDLPSMEALIVRSRRVHDQSKTSIQVRHNLLAEAHRELREPLTALLRLNDDLDCRRTDAVAQRMIEQQRQTIEVLTDLIDGFLTVTEPETAWQPTMLTDLAARSRGGKPRQVSATYAPPAQTWSAEWSMEFTLHQPEPTPRAPGILLIDRDQGAMGALRIYLLCAGYRVFAAVSAVKGLELARMAPSLIDIVIADLDLAADEDGLAAIDDTRRLTGYNVPAVLLMDQASIEIGDTTLAADVSRLRKPVNVDELNALIGAVLNRPKARPRPAQQSTAGAKMHDDRSSARPAACETLTVPIPTPGGDPHIVKFNGEAS